MFFFNVALIGNIKAIQPTNMYAIDLAVNINKNSPINMPKSLILIVSFSYFNFKQYAINIATVPIQYPSFEYVAANIKAIGIKNITANIFFLYGINLSAIVIKNV